MPLFFLASGAVVERFNSHVILAFCRQYLYSPSLREFRNFSLSVIILNFNIMCLGIGFHHIILDIPKSLSIHDLYFSLFLKIFPTFHLKTFSSGTPLSTYMLNIYLNPSYF